MEKRSSILTDREQEVLRLIAVGLSNATIAAKLAVSSNTVAWHIRQIFNKLNVRRRTQAVAIAHALGLLEGITPTVRAHTTLPTPPTPFIGRQAELIHILDLLAQSETRLLTILGPGGIGKTRLALAVGRAVQTRLASTVHFVLLDGIHSVEHLLPAIANAVGYQFRGAVEPRLQLLSYLHNRTLLLMLDGCEHLLEAVPFFAEMLETCEDIKILVTSRERLNQRGETVVSLTGLSYLRNEQHEHSSDAVKLFIQSAQRVDTHFKPDEGNLCHIEHICQLVEGMPLAIELAASWMHHLSPEQIAIEIEKSPAILQTSARDVPLRHRSMAAVFTHSWNLLTDEEQSAFMKLSVFQGDFDRMAAEQVAGTMLSILNSLVNKSRIHPHGQGRYHVHEMLRRFGADKLAADAAVLRDTQTRFARYYLNYLYQRRSDVEGSNSPDVIQELRQSIDNIWAAWRIGGEQCLALEISRASRDFAVLHTSTGLISNLVTAIEYVLPFLRAQQHHPDVSVALADVLMMLVPAYTRYFPEKSLNLLEEAAAHLDRLENPPDGSLALLYSLKAMVLMAMKQSKQAANEMKTAFALCEHIQDHTILAWAALTFAAALIELDCYQQAHDVLQSTQERIGNFSAFFFQSYMLSAAALIFTGLGRYSDAQRTLTETIQENRRYTHAVPFDLFLLAASTYLHRMGLLEYAYEMICLYFQPAFPNILLQSKARSLLGELEAQVSAEMRESIVQRADIWLSETPSIRNPLGLRGNFYDYITQLIQSQVQA